MVLYFTYLLSPILSFLYIKQNVMSIILSRNLNMALKLSNSIYLERKYVNIRAAIATLWKEGYDSGKMKKSRIHERSTVSNDC